MVEIQGRDLPLPYLAGLTTLVVLAALLAGTTMGWINIESLYTFLVLNTAVALTAMGLAAVGGAFVGMLASYRLFSTREFTPFERAVMETLRDVRELEDRLDETEDNLRDEIRHVRDLLEDEGR